VRDVRVWWGLFVFFAALSVLVVQRRYYRWRGVKRQAAESDPRVRAELDRRLRLEGWRLVLMAVSILAMSGVVVTVFWPGPVALLQVLRVVALLAVAGVLLLSVRLQAR
jgi:CHASE2 domain-containing sensor protein